MTDDDGAGGILNRPDLIALESYWRDQRLEYTSGLVDYIGRHHQHKAPTSNENWAIWKFTWTGSDCIRIEGPLTGAWDNRASLAWA